MLHSPQQADDLINYLESELALLEKKNDHLTAKVRATSAAHAALLRHQGLKEIPVIEFLSGALPLPSTAGGLVKCRRNLKRTK